MKKKDVLKLKSLVEDYQKWLNQYQFAWGAHETTGRFHTLIENTLKKLEKEEKI